jgi:hypothetical protein
LALKSLSVACTYRRMPVKVHGFAFAAVGRRTSFVGKPFNPSRPAPPPMTMNKFLERFRLASGESS